MGNTIQLRAIKPKRLKVDVFEKGVNKGLDRIAKLIEGDFNETQRTFKRKFPVEIDKGDGWRLIFVDSDIYSYVSRGTRIRWALMSRDWQSKTAPGRFRPGPGRGRVVIAGRGAMQRRGIAARPGIKARKFDEQIVKKDTRQAQRILDGEIAKASKKAF